MRPPEGLAFPYGWPDNPADLAQIDRMILPLVERINASGWAWTVQSCEGHPWPMLEVYLQRPAAVVVPATIAAHCLERQALVVTRIAVQCGTGEWELWRFEVVCRTLREREAALAALAAPWTDPVAEWVKPCDRCDGVGWYEGGPTLQTKCEQCDGTGIARP